jgi:hypothetical protein
MTAQSNTPGRKPTHRLYTVEGDGESANWLQIGAAWPNKDRKGFNLVCRAMPFTGLIVMREIVEKEGAEGES